MFAGCEAGQWWLCDCWLWLQDQCSSYLCSRRGHRERNVWWRYTYIIEMYVCMATLYSKLSSYWPRTTKTLIEMAWYGHRCVCTLYGSIYTTLRTVYSIYFSSIADYWLMVFCYPCRCFCCWGQAGRESLPSISSLSWRLAASNY